jgi:prepilin-type N-terminal cleavage/methylation domain-containing protein
MNASRRAGFTLIELLTVIAIIAILAAMAFTIAPRMIEKAKITRMNNAMKQVSTALFAYLTDTKLGSYPHAYGYVGAKQGPNPPGPSNPSLDETYYHLRPFMSYISMHGNEKMYDEFSNAYDTDRDGRLSLLEFSPIGKRDQLGATKFLPGLPRYTGGGEPAEEVGLQTQPNKQRPFLYIPVNLAQEKRAAKYWIRTGNTLAQTWDTTAPELQGMTFPPVKYDGFVLISVGPGGSTCGIVADDPTFFAAASAQNGGRDAYHIMALRAYFLATRDLNANGKLDFDFTARNTDGEGKDPGNVLPDGTNGWGPMIYVSQ